MNDFEFTTNRDLAMHCLEQASSWLLRACQTIPGENGRYYYSEFAENLFCAVGDVEVCLEHLKGKQDCSIPFDDELPF